MSLHEHMWRQKMYMESRLLIALIVIRNSAFYCDRNFWNMKTQKSMVSKLLVALLNSLSHTWQLKKVQNALFQVSYFMLYRMVFPKILCNRPANQYLDRFHCGDSFMLLQKKKHFYQLTRVFKTNSIWSRHSAFEQIMVSLLAGPTKNV